MNYFNHNKKWIYFVQVSRVMILALILASTLYFLLNNFFEISKLFQVLISFLLFFSVIYFQILKILKPLIALEYKLSVVQKQLPYQEQLRGFYRNDWSNVDYILDYVLNQFQGQKKIIKNESSKNKLLLESIQNAILAIDSEGNLLFTNPLFIEIFVDSHVTINPKMKIWTLLPYSLVEELKEILSNPKVKKIKSYAHQKIQQSYFFDISLVPLRLEEETVGALAVFHDVTERKAIEQMRVDFIANISHEIRTPLTSIHGYAQFCKDPSLSSQKYQDGLDKILRNADRMLDLFNDLLHLSVIDAQTVIKAEVCSLKSFIEQAQSVLKDVYPSKNIEINYQLKTDDIFVEQKIFDRVFINLLDNSYKYGYDRQSISISSQILENQIIITYSDQSEGIDFVHWQRIFERFYRVDQKKDPTKSSSGLGLAIVKNIIQKHGGEIKVTSEKNLGTTFIISLPRKDIPTQVRKNVS